MNLLYPWMYFDVGEGEGGGGDPGGGGEEGGGSDYAGGDTSGDVGNGQSENQVAEDAIIQDLGIGLDILAKSTRITTSGTSSTLSQENLFIVNPQRGFEIVGKPSIKIESKNPENWVVEEIVDSRLNKRKSVIFNIKQKQTTTAVLSNNVISFDYHTVPILLPRYKMIDGLSIPGLINKSNKVEGFIPAIGDYIYITISGIAGARFNLTIDNINDISILEEPLKNIEIPESGLYRFLQRFPEISNTSVANKFKINLTVGDGTFLNRKLPTTDPMWTINQFADVTVTFTKDTGTATGVTYSGSDTTITGRAKSLSTSHNTSVNSYAVTAAKAGALVYVKPIADHFSSNNYYITKKIQEKITNKNIIKLGDTVIVAKDASGNVVKTIDIEKGMLVKLPKVTKTKIRNIDATTAYPITNKIKLDNTHSLLVGMVLEGTEATITSVDDETDITLSQKVDITNNTTINFRTKQSTVVVTSVDLNNQEVVVDTNLTLDKYSKITIIADKTKINNEVVVSASGSASATFTNNLQVSEFDVRDVIYTQSLDNTFTLTPNVRNQYYQTYKDTAIGINVLSGDTDDNTSTKTPSIVSNPRHGVISGSFGSGDGIVTYTPVGAFVGEDSFTFKVNDTITDSGVATAYITIK